MADAATSELHSGSPRLHGLGGKLGGTSKWNNLGAALLIGGRHDEGVAMLEGVVAEKPEMREAHINLGSFFDEEGVPEKSKHHYRKVSGWGVYCYNFVLLPSTSY